MVTSLSSDDLAKMDCDNSEKNEWNRCKMERNYIWCKWKGFDKISSFMGISNRIKQVRNLYSTLAESSMLMIFKHKKKKNTKKMKFRYLIILSGGVQIICKYKKIYHNGGVHSFRCTASVSFHRFGSFSIHICVQEFWLFFAKFMIEGRWRVDQ